MKLFDYCYYDDFGHEWYFQLLPISTKFALIDMCIQWDDFASLEWCPYVIIGIGPRDIGFCFRWRRFQLRFDVLDFDRRNLSSYRHHKSDDYRPLQGLSQ
jgi:hypothetical protein